MKKKDFLHRRTFLRGLFSTAIHLPILDIMLNSHGEAFAQGVSIPKNYFSVYAGIALASGHTQQTQPILMPATTGTLSQLPPALQPLDAHGVKNLVQVISNLYMPFKDKAGGVGNIHGVCERVQLMGYREDVLKGKQYNSPDVIFAASSKKATRPLTIGVQASGYNGDVSTVSYSKGLRALPNTNLFQIYQNLIGNVSSDNSADEARRVFEFKKRGTILDLVKDDLNQFKKKLGAADKIKMDRHISSMRDLENQLGNVGSETIASCNKIANPGPDRAVSSILDKSKWDKNGQVLNNQENYTGEIERAKIAADLAHMAISCGLNNVVNIMGTYNHPWLNAGPITGIYTDFHNFTHGGGKADNGKEYDEGLRKAHAWHIDIYANLIKKLKNTTVGGSSLYDHSVGVYFCEAGMGTDYYNYKGSLSRNEKHLPHSAENMMMLVSGTLGGLKPGKHFNANRQHPTQVFISVLKSLGVNINTLGEISGRIDELYS